MKEPDKAPQLRQSSRSLPIALLRAREKVMGPNRKILASENVVERQWRVLAEMAHHACLLAPSLTRILQGLETRELIQRVLPATNSLFSRLEETFGKRESEYLLDLLNALDALPLNGE